MRFPEMKIRTITLGISGIPTAEKIRWAGGQLERATNHFSSQGHVVQSRRLALAHWDVGIGVLPESHRTDILQMVYSVAREINIDLCSVGIARAPDQIAHMARILIECPILSGSADIGDVEHGLNTGAIRAAAEAIRYLAMNTERGFGNFLFGAGVCLQAGSPFFPGSYHRGDRPSFTIGFENSDLLVVAFSESDSFEIARVRLFDLLLSNYRLVEASAEHLSNTLGVGFGGIDTSIAPSLEADESIVCAFSGLSIEFGKRGTLAACGLTTDVVKSLPVKQTGYSGIMLSVLEDKGLSKAVEEGRLSVTDLITYSCVCGVGVDMVPIPGDVSLTQLEALILDVGVMAVKLRKPLSVRVLPVPGKHAGEITEFTSPHVCNSRVMTL